MPVFGNPDLPPEGAVNLRGNDRSARMDGPRNRRLEHEFPSACDAPPTDISTQPFFWSSFNISPRRQQQGGWARELTQADFALSTEISGVNMYLAPGGVRELHWHRTAEWAIMTRGRCRVTMLDQRGQLSIEDVAAGDIWYFPAGLPHSLQGLGPDGAEFVIAFDDGAQSESNTLLITDWLAHTPPDVLAKNFGVPSELFEDIPLNNLWIFQGVEPGPLEDERRSSGAANDAEPVIFRLSRAPYFRSNSGGGIQVADSTNFPIAQTVACALVTVQPGGMREMHWHPNADEWQYYLQGSGRMTVFDTGPRATTNDFRAGDVGIVRRNCGHYVENTGSEPLQFVEVFRAAHYQEVSLANWMARLPSALLEQHLNLDPAAISNSNREGFGITPLGRSNSPLG